MFTWKNYHIVNQSSIHIDYKMKKINLEIELYEIN